MDHIAPTQSSTLLYCPKSEFLIPSPVSSESNGKQNTRPLSPHFTEVTSSVSDTGNESCNPSYKGNNKLGKKSSRRNAWGNLSYADLITQAILSSPEKRLTLSQVYDWMVQNVPYFKDKGDNNSSAGWKNSIRHNLSLHNRFVRVQNEGTGKSSWWMVNPDSKQNKSKTIRKKGNETHAKIFSKRGRTKKSKNSQTLPNQTLHVPCNTGSVEQDLVYRNQSSHSSEIFGYSNDFYESSWQTSQYNVSDGSNEYEKYVVGKDNTNREKAVSGNPYAFCQNFDDQMTQPFLGNTKFCDIPNYGNGYQRHFGQTELFLQNEWGMHVQENNFSKFM